MTNPSAQNPSAAAPASKSTPKLVKSISTRHSLLYWGLFGGAILVMALCALVSLAGNFLESGATTIIGVIAAVFLVPIYVSLFLWLDRFEPEPPQLLLAAFVWGAGVAGLFACILNTIFGTVAAQVIDPNAADQLMASLSAPVIEESLKGLAVAVLFFWLKDEFDDVMDGIIYAGMAALGFAMIENISYYSRAFNGGGVGGLVGNFFLRGILSPYTHVLFTSMTGIGFGIARQTKNVPLKFIAPFVGWILAMTLHCIWNTLPWLLGVIAGDQVGTLLFFVFYFVLWIPLFIALLGVIAYSLRRESKLIKRHLLEKSEVSHIDPTEADSAARLLPRLLGNINVLISKGTAAWMKTRRFQHAATALAFYRERLERGRIVANPELEALYIEQVTVNRPTPKP